MPRRKFETRFVVAKDYYSDNGDNLRDDHCVLFATRDEAEVFMAKLNAGCDPGWFDPANCAENCETPEQAFLFIDEINI